MILLWDSSVGEKRYHLVNLEACLLTEESRWAGDFVCEQGLTGKVLWHFGEEEDKPWKVVIEVKYGSRDLGWNIRESSDSYKTCLWKEVAKARMISFYVHASSWEMASYFALACTCVAM